MNHGADVNCVSDTGSTPVRSACFMTHLEIVRLLVKYSANIQRSVRANNEYITTTTYWNAMTPNARGIMVYDTLLSPTIMVLRRPR